MSAPRKCRRIGDAAPVHGPGSADAAAVHDLQARIYYHPKTGEVLADAAAWERASEGDKARARERLAAVQQAEDLIALGIPRLDADRTAAAEAGAKPGAVGAWRRKLKGLPEGARVAALLDGKAPGAPSTLDPVASEILEALALHHGTHLTAAHAHETLEARACRTPSIRSVRRWLARWRDAHERELSAVTNPDRHRSHRKPAGGDASAHVERLNQEWELDSTLADVMCADGKRHAVVSAIDIWSRRARILIVPTSRSTAIAALLRRCILDWGVPEVVRTDEGKDYTSQHVFALLADLEIDPDTCPPYTPEAKPHVERFLGTLARDLFAFLPGFCGHDVAQAKALRDRKSFAARRAKRAQGARREEPPKVFAVSLTAEGLQAECDRWCRARYERRPHSGLGGLSPFERAGAWTGTVRTVRDERALDALLAAPAAGGWRVVGKGGIRLDNVDYIAGPLGRLDKERVRVRRDPADLDRIFVYLADGTFVCVAEDPARTGADRMAIANAMKAEWNSANREARARARELAKRHRPERSMADVLDHAERKAGRVVALPRKGEAHDTPALREAARAAEAAEAADKADAATERPSQSKVMAGARRLFLEEE